MLVLVRAKNSNLYLYILYTDTSATFSSLLYDEGNLMETVNKNSEETVLDTSWCSHLLSYLSVFVQRCVFMCITLYIGRIRVQTVPVQNIFNLKRK